MRVQREMADFIDANSTFWLVRARVGPGGITGLETVLTGAYIEASFDTTNGPPQRRFTALTRPPLTPAGPARHTGDAALARPADRSPSGAPVLFKQIAVGQIESVELTEEGRRRASRRSSTPPTTRD